MHSIQQSNVHLKFNKFLKDKETVKRLLFFSFSVFFYSNKYSDKIVENETILWFTQCPKHSQTRHSKLGVPD